MAVDEVQQLAANTLASAEALANGAVDLGQDGAKAIVGTLAGIIHALGNVVEKVGEVI